MRIGLKTLRGSFITHWSYAMIGQLDKSLFYQSLLTKPELGAAADGRVRALLSDFRNLTLKWVFLSARLTPLAGTEKKAISGFDTRLVSMKSPKKVKAVRAQELMPLGHSGTAHAISTFYPYLSHSAGWGVRSSHSGAFLRGKGLTNFAKKSSRVAGFTAQGGCLNPNLAAGRLPFAQKAAVLGASPELNFLFNVYENNALHPGSIENAHLVDARDDPNLAALPPAPHSGGPSLWAFKGYTLWLAGLSCRAGGFSYSPALKGARVKTYASQLLLLRGL